jgi:hypothetical protein
MYERIKMHEFTSSEHLHSDSEQCVSMMAMGESAIYYSHHEGSYAVSYAYS